MKYFVKVFFCMILVITIALALMGYVLISHNFENALSREKARVLEEYQLLKFSLQAGMINAAEQGAILEEVLSDIADQTAKLVPEGNLFAVYTENYSIWESNFPFAYSFSEIATQQTDKLYYTMDEIGGTTHMLVSGYFEQSDMQLYLSVGRDVGVVLEEQQAQMQDYMIIYGIILCISAVALSGISFLLTRPIGLLTKAAGRIADGHYSERVYSRSHDEIGMLAQSFNKMAENVEEKIYALELNARQKEDFVANFAHELKTPLTSVIGYADMLYSKQCDEETIHMAAGYILSEGMRLEALSFKLMELTVLGKQDFLLQEMPARELLEDVIHTLAPVMREKQILLTCQAEQRYIWAEYDLMKTMILNLIDNAAKADSTHIHIRGGVVRRRYEICIEDDGCGMAKEELSRITEAFYMVDKARSRGQHGAGLGLAIAVKIAKIHGTRLEYTSEIGRGTSVRFSLPMERMVRKNDKRKRAS